MHEILQDTVKHQFCYVGQIFHPMVQKRIVGFSNALLQIDIHKKLWVITRCYGLLLSYPNF